MTPPDDSAHLHRAAAAAAPHKMEHDSESESPQPNGAANGDRDLPAIQSAIAFELLFGVVGIIAAWFAGIRILEDFGKPTLKIFGLGVVGTLPLVAVIAAIDRLQFPLFEELSELMREFAGTLFGAKARLTDMAVTAAAAGVGEEIFFRGFVQALSMRFFDPPLAIFIASMLFGAAHALTKTYAAITTLMGAYLGLVAYLTGSLWVPVLIHGLYDFWAFARLRADAMSAED